MPIMAQQPDGAEAMAASVPTGGITEIHAHETGRKYKVIDLDNNEIERTAAELVDGSKLLNNRELWIANFRATVARVRQWCDGRAETVKVALVDIRSTKVLFYFVPDADRYDLSLGDAMTDLEVELGGSAGIGPVETLQAPARSLDRFAGPKSLLVWERPQASSSAKVL